MGDRITVTQVITGEVSYVNTNGNYVEVTRDEDGAIYGFSTYDAGVTYTIHVPEKKAIDVYRELEPGQKFRLSGPSVYSGNSPRVKINDEMYYNTDTGKTVKIDLTNILDSRKTVLEVIR